jgi:hypothetical protein
VIPFYDPNSSSTPLVSFVSDYTVLSYQQVLNQSPFQYNTTIYGFIAEVLLDQNTLIEAVPGAF